VYGDLVHPPSQAKELATGQPAGGEREAVARARATHREPVHFYALTFGFMESASVYCSALLITGQHGRGEVGAARCASETRGIPKPWHRFRLLRGCLSVLP
jgi:hypothetical protein